MDGKTFRERGYAIVDWIANYMDTIEDYPVMPDIQPGDIKKQLPASPPEQPEAFEVLLRDFNDTIVPGMTHWQHPSFFAYFPANTSESSIYAEFLTAALGAQCMVWQTSPAATELEEVVMDWLKGMIGLPEHFSGVIQDTASTSTLCGLLSARERATDYRINRSGFHEGCEKKLTVYTSEEAHSSIEKAVKISGIGKDNIRLIPTDANFSMIPGELEKAIFQDLEAGFQPCFTCATLGTTSSTAMDPIRAIGEICGKHGIWLHVDAAMAGTAALLPDMRGFMDGVELADSLVFNPHKWMFTNFDCSAYFCKDANALTATFEILPEYLKTAVDRQVKNFRDWGVPLGRRFRALKLWFVIRHFGVKGLQDKVRNHIELAKQFEQWVAGDSRFELMAPRTINLVCFRFNPKDGDLTEDELEALNKSLMDKLNKSGKLFFTHTKLKGRFSLRMCIAQTDTTLNHVEEAWKAILSAAEKIG